MEYRLAHFYAQLDGGLKKALMEELQLPGPLAHILCQRGFSTVEQVHDFLFPQLASLPSPMLLHGMDKAVERIIDALREQKTVYVHGDYDVDGISATVLLVDFLRSMGLRTRFHIPNRLKEKYGLSRTSIEKLCAADWNGLLVTVDCGISNADEVAFARDKGLQVVVTDHHEPPARLPLADAVVNPKLEGCSFPYPHLSGVGVAFFLVAALRRRLVSLGFWERDSAPNLKRCLDLVALGTVADVMPMTGVNRVLVRAGLEMLAERVRPGVLALCESANLWSRHITSEDISYRLAPRINAPGRLGRPELSVALLLAGSLDEARTVAALMESANEERKQLEADILPEIYARCREQVGLGRKALAVYHEDCHPGIIGIAASRVVEMFGRPVLIFTDDSTQSCGSVLKGSGRSVDGLNLHEVLRSLPQELILQHGGHAMAVGLTLTQEKMADFAEKLDVLVKKVGPLPSSRIIYVDYQLHSSEAFGANLTRALQYMQPFGEGNPEPVFMLRNERLLNGKIIKSHLRFQLQHNRSLIQGIGFGLGRQFGILSTPVDLVFKLRRSSFKGVERDEVQALHIEAAN